MDQDHDHILLRIITCLGRITESDFSSIEVDMPLNLDSIARISLIAEIENEFEVELDSKAVQPESFETLNTLLALVNAHRK